MLDLASQAIPPHWRLAPLPDAPLYQAEPNRMLRGGGREYLAVSPALLAALAAPALPGTVLRASDSSGAAWRLRQVGGAWWQVQSLADSHARLFERLRSTLARQLLESVLHELRGPLNALSLHADLLERLLAPGGQADAAARARHSVTVMRERTRELGARQDAMAALWLGEADAAGAELGALVADCLHLLRGQLAAQQVRLHAQDLDALGAARLPRSAGAARIALLALLLAAGAGARDSGAAVMTIRGSVADGAALLEVQAPLQTQALAGELCGTGEEWVAALALLLEPCGLRLEVSAERALSRLVLTP